MWYQRLSRTLVLAASLFGLLLFSACDDTIVGDNPDDGSSSVLLRSASGASTSTYIVVLKGHVNRAADVAQDVANRQGGDVLYTYEHALKGFAIRIPEQGVEALQNNPNVAFIEPDGPVEATDLQNNPTWGLDRVDQRELPLDNAYQYEATGAGVTAYIIDTGIRYDHVDFGGRATFGFDYEAGGDGSDCNGHGTHVAGTVGSATWGLAKEVHLVAVRVLNCSGSGTWSGVIAGVDWVTANAKRPAVANMSLGGGANSSIDQAIRNSISAGVTYAVAAGNSSADACNYSPARVAEALTVGATTSSDARAYYSNYGSCVDIFAPGSAITSTYNTSSTATRMLSGTSMASPHVAGAAALYLERYPDASSGSVFGALIDSATPDVVGAPGNGSPNRLLYALADAGSPPPPPPPSNAPPTPDFSFVVDGLTVQFTDESTDSDGSVVHWEWLFKDGSASLDQHTSHTYAQAGSYEVEHIVEDNEGARRSITKTVTVGTSSNAPPTADFSYSATELTVQFTDASVDPDGSVVDWSWDFGDGGSASSQNRHARRPFAEARGFGRNRLASSSQSQHPQHTYAEAGTYSVQLTVTDDDGASHTVTKDVTVTAPPPANTPPVADFSYNASDLTASFTDASTDSDGQVVAWTWSFDDGQSATQQHPSHTYAAAGTYSVQLTVTDDDGASHTVTKDVTVTAPPPANTPPVADFSYSATELTVQFTDASVDPDGTVMDWSWDFGAGSGASSQSQNPQHTYAEAGTYSVLLTVTDDAGATNTVTKDVTVSALSNTPPVADFSYSATELTVQFTDASTDSDGSVVAWSWGFGDGQSATQQHPSHTYAAAGTFSVQLTVTDDAGATHTVTKDVTVTAPPPPPAQIVLSVSKVQGNGPNRAELTWEGAQSHKVDIYRNEALINTAPNRGTFTDTLGNGRNSEGTFTYRVCEEGTSMCSNTSSVTF